MELTSLQRLTRTLSIGTKKPAQDEAMVGTSTNRPHAIAAPT
jgi:hypothetical protein